MTKKTKKKLLLFFLGILLVKVFLSLFIKNIIVYPDESCIIQKASFFAEHLALRNCGEIAHMPAGDPFPLYSILLAPIYLFSKNILAFKLTLIFNAILTSTLVFPIFQILTKFIKKEKTTFLYTFVLLFISQVLLYEKMLMSENLFLITSIWFLFFYIESFGKNKANKTIALIIAILSIFIRPFGFILLLAMGINEFIHTKKKTTATIIFILTIAALFFVLQMFIPEIGQNLYQKIASLSEPRNILLLGKALKNQLNSLIIATFFVPLVIFVSNIGKDKSKAMKNIRYFLISFIALNFLITAQHIYNYYIRGAEQDLIIRYLNVSSFFIIFFSFIFIEKVKKIKINTAVLIILALPLLFLSYDTLNHALNLELSPYFKTFDGFISGDIFFKTIFLPLIFLLAIAMIFHKRKLLIVGLISILLLNSIAIFAWQTKYTKNEFEDPVFQYFINKNDNILFIESAMNKDKPKNINFNYWKILAFTDLSPTSITYNDLNKENVSLDINKDIPKEFLKNKDYIVTKYELNLPLIIDYPYYPKVYKIEQNQE